MKKSIIYIAIILLAGGCTQGCKTELESCMEKAIETGVSKSEKSAFYLCYQF